MVVVVLGRKPPPDFYHFRPAAMRNDIFTATYSLVPPEPHYYISGTLSLVPGALYLRDDEEERDLLAKAKGGMTR